MPRVEYSSDEDLRRRRASWVADSSDSAKESLRNASRRAKGQVKQAADDTESNMKSHKSQIAVAAAFACGLAIAGFVVSKIRGNNGKQAGSDDRAPTSSVSEAQPPAALQTNKLAARRKRSGYLSKSLARRAVHAYAMLFTSRCRNRGSAQ